jgi:hypothetical protein
MRFDQKSEVKKHFSRSEGKNTLAPDPVSRPDATGYSGEDKPNSAPTAEPTSVVIVPGHENLIAKSAASRLPS